MAPDDFNINIDFAALTAGPAKKRGKKNSSPKKKTSSPSKKHSSSSTSSRYPPLTSNKPLMNPNSTIQVNLDGHMIPNKTRRVKKSQPVIDPAYISEINYKSSPGKLTIEIAYSPKEGRDYRQGSNYAKFCSEDLFMTKRLLERFG